MIDAALLRGGGFGGKASETGERVIRAGVLYRACLKYPGALVTHEFTGPGVWGWRFDVVALSENVLHGYEIKSDRDSVHRLSGQVEGYAMVCKTLTVCTGYKHAHEVARIVPVWVGIDLVYAKSGVAQFETVREGRDNPGWRLGCLMRLLWIEDVKEALRRARVKGITRDY